MLPPVPQFLTSRSSLCAARSAGDSGQASCQNLPVAFKRFDLTCPQTCVALCSLFRLAVTKLQRQIEEHS